jgi:hypothetical protein
MSGCEPDSAGGLPACPAPIRQASSLAAESAKLADIQLRPSGDDQLGAKAARYWQRVDDDAFHQLELSGLFRFR